MSLACETTFVGDSGDRIACELKQFACPFAAPALNVGPNGFVGDSFERTGEVNRARRSDAGQFLNWTV